MDFWFNYQFQLAMIKPSFNSRKLKLLNAKISTKNVSVIDLVGMRSLHVQSLLFDISSLHNCRDAGMNEANHEFYEK